MKIKEVTVKNFKSIKESKLECDILTALLGANGTGKSSFLRAIELFYSGSPRITTDDFYNGDTSQDIEIAVTFCELSDPAKEMFAPYLEGEELTVVRVLSLEGAKMTATYHGFSLQHPAFSPIRAVTTAGAKKPLYEELQINPEYADLPRWTILANADDSFISWEQEHPEQCERMRDEGQFFGFKEVAQGYLGRFTRFIIIPAVRDADLDALDAKGSVITNLMDMVVRSVLAAKEDLTKLKEETQQRFDEIVDPSQLDELTGLAGRLAETLQTYVPDSSVSIDWIKSGSIELPLPRADVRLIEDGYASTVGRTGHGLQRAFILTMLQHLAIARPVVTENADNQSAGGDGPDPNGNQAQEIQPSLLLAIEEPELYQHPNRQRHFAQILLDLASGSIAGVAQQTQVIYCTHSPLFVGVDRLDHVRLLRKVPYEPDKPKITHIARTSLSEVARTLWDANGQPTPEYDSESLRARLQAIMTPWMNEGFFADVVVLVEGEDDRAAILGMANAMGVGLERDGYCVIPCMGKNSIDRPMVIFRNLGIPLYAVWDSDYGTDGARPEVNRYLLRLMRAEEDDWPSCVEDEYACFRSNLEVTVREEIGPVDFDRIVTDIQDDFGVSRRHRALKMPMVMQRVIQIAGEQGKSSPTLEGIVTRLQALKAKPSS